MNYPHKKKLVSNESKSTTFGKRGMSFEEDLNKSNDYYLANNIAVIHKKPTPVQIVKVNYPKRAAAVITEAYFRTPSTTDYNGVYKGQYIDFEAKETSNITLFPLQNLHIHQVQHMENVLKHGGIIFMLVKFSKLNEIYLLPGENLIDFWQQYKVGTRKSIKLDDFKTYGVLLKEGAYPRIDYLKVVEELFL
ncbi:MAG: Holliday junction resolvase RecU [Turicibacter sp.]